MIGWGMAVAFGVINWAVLGNVELHTVQLLWTSATAGALGMHLGTVVQDRLST